MSVLGGGVRLRHVPLHGGTVVENRESRDKDNIYI